MYVFSCLKSRYLVGVSNTEQILFLGFFYCSGIDGLRFFFVSFPPTIFCFHPLHLFFVSSVLFKGKWRFQSCPSSSLTKTVWVFCGLAPSYLFLRRMQGGLSIWKGITRFNLLEVALHHHFLDRKYLLVCLCMPTAWGSWNMTGTYD